MIAFFILAIGLIATALYTINASKPVHSVIGLLTHFVFLAITYITLSAEFLAVTQIIVYSGAILILFVFVIALLSGGIATFDIGPDRLPRIAVPAFLALMVVLGTIMYATSRSVIPSFTLVADRAAAAAAPVGSQLAFGSVSSFGAALFSQHVLPFEITAFILITAIVAVVLLASQAEDIAPPPRAPRRERDREPILREGGS